MAEFVPQGKITKVDEFVPQGEISKVSPEGTDNGILKEFTDQYANPSVDLLTGEPVPIPSPSKKTEFQPVGAIQKVEEEFQPQGTITNVTSEEKAGSIFNEIWEASKAMFPPLKLASDIDKSFDDWKRPEGGKDLPVDKAVKTVKNIVSGAREAVQKQGEGKPTSGADAAIRNSNKYWEDEFEFYKKMYSETPDILKPAVSIPMAVTGAINALHPKTAHSPKEKILSAIEFVLPSGESELARDVFVGKLSSASTYVDKAVKGDGIVKKAYKAGMAKVDDKFPEFAKKKKEFVTAFREAIDTSTIRIKNLEKESGVTQEVMPTESYISLPGRVQTAVNKAEKQMKYTADELFSTSKKLNIDRKVFEKDVEEYLINKRVPELNVKHPETPNWSGRNTEIANKEVERISNLPHFEQIKEAADKLKKYNDENLDILYADGQPWGLITKEELELFRREHPNHISFQRVMDDDDYMSIATKGLDVKSSGVKRMKGSQREISNIFENTYANRIQAIQRIEKNKSNNVFYEWAEKFQEEVPDQNILKIGQPKAIGETFGEDAKIIKETITDPFTFQFKRFGKDNYIEFSDPKLALAVKGTNKHRLPDIPLFTLPAKLLRFMATSHTAGNPEFGIVNFIRDTQDDVLYLTKEGINESKIGGGFMESARSMKAIRDYNKGIKTSDSILYGKFKEAGWTTGGLGMSTKQDVAKKFKNIQKEIESTPYRTMHKIFHVFDDYNQMIEDGNRFTTFRIAQNSGKKFAEAGKLSKEAGLNFNEMGTWGPLVNSIWMFSNASLRASKRSIKIMTDPKVATETALAMATATGVINQHNESIDPEYDKRFSQWDKDHGINILLPNNPSIDYIHIPLAPTLHPAKAMIDSLSKLRSGKKVDTKDIIEKVGYSIIQGLNPLADESIEGLIPSVGKPIADIKLNRTWYDQKMYPDYDPNAPDDIKYFPDSMRKTMIGRGLVSGTKYLADKKVVEMSPAAIEYALKQYGGGRLSFYTKTANTVSSIAKGELPPINEVPFLSRLLRKSPKEAVFNETEKKFMKYELKENARGEFYKDLEFDDLLKEYFDSQDMTKLNEFIGNQDIDERGKYYIDIVNSTVHEKVPGKRFYEALKQMPTYIAKSIFEDRYNKSTPDVQKNMMGNAAIMKLFTPKYFMKKSKDIE